MRLVPFIKKNKEEIADEWVEYARENISAADEKEVKQVKDHIIEMLESIAKDMEVSESNSEQEAKSKGNKEVKNIHATAAKEHGTQRVKMGFNIVELSSEFRALRASVLRLWSKEKSGESDEDQVHDIIRFNEAIDEAWIHSLKKFDSVVQESKNWFLSVLGHDLRSPLAAILGAQQVLGLSDKLTEKEKRILRRTEASAKSMKELINNLLELTNLRLGKGMTITRSSVDLSRQGEEIIQEFQLAYPESKFKFDSRGPVQGDWDRLRLKQVLTNLIANALRHGKAGGPVTLKISTKGKEAIFSVHNEGNPIPKDVQKQIFDGRFSMEQEPYGNENSYGLGLYIVKEIIKEHEGEIKLESSAKKGTTFTIVLPRHVKFSKS
ncbi:sensor histidine kinase [Salinimicrobium catena]|uniref:sensor histidine kinase n=1 Tax=Salinimicrobium catena TaxID=390640 RepID=UPI002FE47C4A